MAPFYADMCAELERTPDKKILSDLKAKNKEQLKKLDEKIEAAGQVEGTFCPFSLIQFRWNYHLVKLLLKIESSISN